MGSGGSAYGVGWGPSAEKQFAGCTFATARRHAPVARGEGGEPTLRAEGATRTPAARTAVVWNALRSVLTERAVATGREALDIVDAGGGTGGFAVPL
ncbi:hypothetical protein AB0J09_41155, partial [Nonomuraea sp. NPDC049784]